MCRRHLSPYPCRILSLARLTLPKASAYLRSLPPKALTQPPLPTLRPKRPGDAWFV